MADRGLPWRSTGGYSSYPLSVSTSGHHPNRGRDDRHQRQRRFPRTTNGELHHPTPRTDDCQTEPPSRGLDGPVLRRRTAGADQPNQGPQRLPGGHPAGDQVATQASVGFHGDAQEPVGLPPLRRRHRVQTGETP